MDLGVSREHAQAPRRAPPEHPGIALPGKESEAAPTDDDLLQRCRRGQAEAWDELVHRYERLVYTVALRNGVGREDAADITQTVFVALLDSIDTIHADGRIASWLMTVARRQAWRLRARQDREEPTARISVDYPGAQDQIAVWERMALLHDALQCLRGPCRDLLLALYFDPAEPSYAAIAHQLGMPIGAIGPRRGRCLEQLRTLLGEDLP